LPPKSGEVSVIRRDRRPLKSARAEQCLFILMRADFGAKLWQLRVSGADHYLAVQHQIMCAALSLARHLPIRLRRCIIIKRNQNKSDRED
jgi:hypothetical protein